MNPADFIVLGILAALVAVVVIIMVKHRNQGGCCGGCSGCAQRGACGTKRDFDQKQADKDPE